MFFARAKYTAPDASRAVVQYRLRSTAAPGFRLRTPTLPLSDRSRPQNGSIHGWGAGFWQKAPAALTPSKRLNIQLSKNELQAVGPWGHNH